MVEIFEATFSYVNIIPTGFLVFTLIYWFSVLIGMLDMNFLDFHVDKEVDIDVDADMEIDVEHEFSVDKDISIDKDVSIDKDLDTELDVSWLNAVLSFFNLGKSPRIPPITPPGAAFPSCLTAFNKANFFISFNTSSLSSTINIKKSLIFIKTLVRINRKKYK